MGLFSILLILLVVTRVFGELALRLHLPALVGELVAGIVLGMLAPMFTGSLPELANLPENEVFRALTDLGVFFLMLLGGLEMRPRKLADSSGSALLVAAGGMVLPLAAGVGLGWCVLPESSHRLPQVLFLGTALAITAIPVAVKVLMDVNKLNSRVGRVIVSAAIFDDVLSLVLLALLTSLIKTGEWPGWGGIGMILLNIAIFFAVTSAIGLLLLPKAAKWIDRTRLQEFEFSVFLIVAFGFAVLAEHLGIHFVLGAFAAGLFFTRETMHNPSAFERAQKQVSGLTTGFLAPVFFASIGLHLSSQAFVAIPGFLVLLVVIAFATKLVGAGVPALLVGLSKRDALLVGSGMSARGAVELIIADIALRAGLFEVPDGEHPIVHNLFSAVVIMAVVTTLLTPIALRLILLRKKS